MSRHLFTSESVSEGHPDKVADQISDAVLDHMLAEDPNSRVACETFVTTGMALVGGEITTNTYVEIPDIVRDTLREIGYTDAAFGIDYKTCAVLSSIDKQSPDIAMGVDTGGAGDQGMMFGYATNETPELMPAPAILSHRIMQKLAELRKSEAVSWLRPDSKSQVTMVYEDGKPVKIDTVVVSTQHGPEVSQEEIHEFVKSQAIAPVLPSDLFDPSDCTFHINPTGKFVIGGPHGDAGLTGRKIIVDTYGGMGRHGGGAFSGKDSTKVDRSAAYAARWAAKNVVAAGLADRCEIQLAYAIGVVQPVSVHVDTFGTSKVDEAAIVKAVRDVFDFSSAGIISALSLRTPIFRPTAAYGHFGRTVEQVERHGHTVTLFPWERTDRVDDLKSAVGA